MSVGAEFNHGSVGEEAEQAISRLHDPEGELAIGNVLRCVCKWAGEGACKQECQLRGLQGIAEAGDVVSEAFAERACADLNLLHALNELGLEPSEVLMVGVTGNEVGFADSLDDYDKLTNNPYGWRELPGFNAFFAREGEVRGLGRRLADCADINYEFQDADGNTVFGFEHGTRTNMTGSSEWRFKDPHGTPISFTEHVMQQAIDHYSADPATMRLKLAAAIQGQNNTYTFESAEKMEEVLPGWQTGGFLKNASNPQWQTGDPINPEDQWEADTRHLILNDIRFAMNRLNIPFENLDASDVLDPNESNGMHSSNKTSYLTGSDNTRDLYLTYLPG